MKNAVLLYLFVLLWLGGGYYQYKKLCQQRGRTGAAALLYRILLRGEAFAVGFHGDQNGRLLKIAFLIKGGELLGLMLLFRTMWVTQWGEAILLLLLLGAGIFGLSYLASIGNGTGEIQCIYPLADEYGVYEIVLGPSEPVRQWVGTTLAELDLRRKELLVMAITRAGKVILFPKGPEVLMANDRLLVFGKKTTLPAEPLAGDELAEE